jgi:hypothetical protein
MAAIQLDDSQSPEHIHEVSACIYETGNAKIVRVSVAFVTTISVPPHNVSSRT